ncbi:MAG: EI24 domain-containing protein [Sandaracinaceae bacterium]|nr:EI24 domain-containing protein [Sandaracinaceae bacterium]
MGIKDGAKLVAKKAVELPKATVVGYWRGLAYPFKGLRFVFFQHPGLARFWIPPILITLALLVLSLGLGWSWHDDIVNWMWSQPTGDGFWVGVLGVLHWLLRALVLLLLWALGLLAVVFLTNVIAAPFNDLLSEAVEEIVTGRPGPPFSLKTLARDSVRTVFLELFKLVIYLAVMLPMFVLSYVPVVGPILYAVVGFLFTTLYFAVDYIDWPASRRSRSIHYRFGMLHEHFLPMFGFGTGVWLFLFIPLVNLLFMPAAVAGARSSSSSSRGRSPSPRHPPELTPGAPVDASAPAQ